MVTLTDGTKIHVCDILLCNVIGADPRLLPHAPGEPYYGKDVRVWIDEAWRAARITNPDDYGNSLSVHCSHGVRTPLAYAPRYDDLNYSKALDLLDLQDPDHPAPDVPSFAAYAHLHDEACVRYLHEGELHHDMIAIVWKGWSFDVHGRKTFAWDDPSVEFLKSETSTDDVRVRLGTRIGVRTPVPGKEGETEEMIYGIAGIDNEHHRIVCKIVGPRHAETKPMLVFDARTLDEHDDVMIYSSEAADTIFQTYPDLLRINDPTVTVMVEYRHEGATHVADSASIGLMDTLPAYLDVRPKGTPYNSIRHRILPKDIVSVHTVPSDEA